MICTRYPLYRGMGGPLGSQHGSGKLRPTGVRTPGVQPVANCRTDYAIPATLKPYICVWQYVVHVLA
jgi:hypothetical protein